jgi:hypothetical protein
MAKDFQRARAPAPQPDEDRLTDIDLQTFEFSSSARPDLTSSLLHVFPFQPIFAPYCGTRRLKPDGPLSAAKEKIAAQV